MLLLGEANNAFASSKEHSAPTHQEVHMSKIEVPWKTLDAAIKAIGTDQVMAYFRVGYYQAMYRKRENARKAAILETAKTDPRFKDAVERANAEVAKMFSK